MTSARVGSSPPGTPHPPAAEPRPFAVERHGQRFEDPYAWLRQRDDPRRPGVSQAENAYADTVLVETKGLQEALYHEMLGRIKQTDLTVPYRYRGHFYYSRTEEGKQYPILCRKSWSLDAEEQVLLDLNALAVGKSFMALGEYAVSDDGGLLAYSTDQTGFEIERCTGADCTDFVLIATRNSSIWGSWYADVGLAENTTYYKRLSTYFLSCRLSVIPACPESFSGAGSR